MIAFLKLRPVEQRHETPLVTAIAGLTHAVMALAHTNETNLILRRIEQKVDKMSQQITDFAAAVNTAFTDIQTDIDGLGADLDKVVSGVANLETLIAQLQNNPGPISPEDQNVLNTLQSAAQTLSANVKSLKSKADAIDTTAPVPTPAGS